MKDRKSEMRHFRNTLACTFVVVVCAFVLASTGVSAQGGGGSGGSGGGGNGSDASQRDGSQTNDLGGTQGTSVTQIQNQNQEKVQNPSTGGSDVPIQNQEQEEWRVQEREQMNSPEELRAYIKAQGGGDGFEDAEQNRMQVATRAVVAAQHLVGQYGDEMAGLGQQIGSSTRTMLQAEEQIRIRSRFVRFLFGGDEDSASTIRNQIRENTERIERLRKYLNECECDGEVREMLQEQIRNMEMEQNRLQQVAEDEETTWGLFSWRF